MNIDDFFNSQGIFGKSGFKKDKPLLQEEEVEESRGLNDSVCVR
jgi:hypothetical protein